MTQIHAHLARGSGDWASRSPLVVPGDTFTDMTPLSIVTDIEQSADFIDQGRMVPANGSQPGALAKAGLLRHGTANGKAVVMLVIEQPDGTQVLAQTTWALFRMAYTALAASPIAAEEVLDP